MFDEEVRRAVSETAAGLDVEAAALLAVAEVESGGRPFALVDGREEPLIRFEGHYFDRRLAGEKRRQARLAGLASPVAGSVLNPATQAARWRLLRQAAAIDHVAAHESVSWGLGQVMGAHWKWLGYETVDMLVAEARSGMAGQIRLMSRYIDKAGLADAIRRRDWHAFARAYNGPAYARHGYHTKIAAAYERHRGAASEPSVDAVPNNAGEDAVRRTRDLQQMLSAAGYPVEVDGINGPLTRGAVRRFQADHDLAVDGIAGPKTQAALRKAMPLGSGGAGIFAAVMRFIRRVLGG